MDTMKQLLLTKLRDKNSSRQQFRQAADNLAFILAQESAEYLTTKKISVETSVGKGTGITLCDKIILVPILRSGMALVPAFLHYYPDAAVGVVGMKRDEKTAIAQLYYKNIPTIGSHDQVIVLDPMIATGGSAVDTLRLLIHMGVREEQILFVAVICSQPGVERVRQAFPNITLTVVTQDGQLNDKKFIVPGLGDFGDRYFGTE